MEKWRFLDTGENTGVVNMATDEAILNLRLQNEVAPTLRVYTWKPACLSVGRRQEIDTINFDKCRELKIDAVRRLTGGAADLHKTELTYSVIFPAKEGTLPRQSYETVCQGIKAAYKIMGVNLGSGFQKIDSPVCFLSTGLTDLTHEGKKLIGSVQLRMKQNNTILQHGSLVIRHHPDILFSIFNFPSKEAKEKEYSTFLKNTTSLSEIIGEVDLIKFKLALLEGFQQIFNAEFFEGGLTENEIRETEKLLKKYGDLDWGEDERKTS